MNRTILCALALAGFAASANAADLSVGSLKDPLPDTLSWHGVTIYGTVDVGYGYQSHGAPGNGDFRQGFEIKTGLFDHDPEFTGSQHKIDIFITA